MDLNRLWPLSRGNYPKQFSNLLDGKTLFQTSALRLSSSKVLEFDQLITLTNSDFRFIVVEQLQEVGIDPQNILIEPEAKNTSAAILAATLFAYKNNKNATLLVAPSDHIIADTDEFHSSIRIGLDEVKRGKIVTFGIKASYPETGYGYLNLESKITSELKAISVKSFVEKPTPSRAEEMIGTGTFLWNSGIFLFKASDMILAFEKYAPMTLDKTKRAVLAAKSDLGFLRLDPKAWSNIDEISIDYAIMEKADNIVAVPYKSKWSDLGGWDAVWSESDKDENGVVLSEGAHAIECSNSLLRSEKENQQIVGLGLDNIVAVATSDAVLIMNKSKSQKVKSVVKYLKSRDITQAEVFPKDHRPWGWFESLVIGDRFQVKRIYVKPEQALSLQSHRHRPNIGLS